MSRLIIFFLLLGISVSGCRSKEAKIDEDLLARVIADMHIADSGLQRQDKRLKDSMRNEYLDMISKIHSIDKMEIKAQVEKVMDDKEKHSKVYTRVIEILKEKEKEIKQLEETKK